jgi:hypothetical protein
MPPTCVYIVEQKSTKHATSCVSSFNTIVSWPMAGMARIRPKGRANFQSDRPTAEVVSFLAIFVYWRDERKLKGMVRKYRGV